MKSEPLTATPETLAIIEDDYARAVVELGNMKAGGYTASAIDRQRALVACYRGMLERERAALERSEG